MVIEDQHLAVQQQRARWQRRDGGGDLPELCGVVLRISREELDPLPLFVNQDAVAVVFFLVDPSGPVEGVLHQRGEHRLQTERDPVAQWARARSTVALVALAISASVRFEMTERGIEAVRSRSEA